MMSLLQFIGILALLSTVGLTVLATAAWLTTRRMRWARGAVGVPGIYLLLVAAVALAAKREVLPPGTAQRFCGFYLDCHLSVAVARVERGGSEWRVTLRLGNDARREALAPVGLRVELLQRDSAAVQLAIMGDDVEGRIVAGGSREIVVAIPAPPNGTTPILRVTEGFGIDRVIEGILLGDDDALGRHRVVLGL